MRQRHAIGPDLPFGIGDNTAHARIHEPRRVRKFRVDELERVLLRLGVGQFRQLLKKRPILESSEHQYLVLISEETFKPTAVAINLILALHGTAE